MTKNNQASNQVSKIHSTTIRNANGITSSGRAGLSKIRHAKSPVRARPSGTGISRKIKRPRSNRWGGLASRDLPLFARTGLSLSPLPRRRCRVPCRDDSGGRPITSQPPVRTRRCQAAEGIGGHKTAETVVTGYSTSSERTQRHPHTRSAVRISAIGHRSSQDDTVFQ